METAFLDGNHWRTTEVTEELKSAAWQLQELQLIAQLKPTFSKDGNQFCFLFGENLQVGIAGFGRTVGQAMADFKHNFYNQKA